MTAFEWKLIMDAPKSTPEALSHHFPSWPPPPDFPISVEASGRVLSRFAYPTWDLSPIANRPCSIGFGDGNTSRGKFRATPENANLLRLATCWLMWGDRRKISAMTVRAHAGTLKRVFGTCSALSPPIAASALSRFDRVVENEIAPVIPACEKAVTIQLLHELYGARDILGFTLLTPAQIGRLAQLIPDRSVRQTPFIPPRIWLYQAERMRLFLDDFVEHSTAVEALFGVALDAYLKNFGPEAFFGSSDRTNQDKSPFHNNRLPAHCVRLGSFMEAADRYGVADLLRRWIPESRRVLHGVRMDHSIKEFAAYFNQVQFVGHHHLLNWSGMRDFEGLTLRSDCLLVEDDPRIGKLYSLRGQTTKTDPDDDARWVTGPEAEVGVQALQVIARLRMRAAALDRRVPLHETDRVNPYLVNRAYEPWQSSKAFDPRIPISTRPDMRSIGQWRTCCQKLFDVEQLRIQPEDERIARLVEPSLDEKKYSVGMIWNLSPHQYRRVALVTMASSGEVSLASQQLQAKHLIRQQTVYYNNGFSGLHFNQEFAKELIVERYKAAARLSLDLSEPHWVSAYGEAHKQRMLVRLHHTDSVDAIQKDMKKGVSAVRLTLFGVCTRRDHCPYGGWDNYVHCPGCAEAFMDSRKRGSVKKMGRTIAVKLLDVPSESPLRSVLESKAKAVEEFMRVTN